MKFSTAELHEIYQGVCASLADFIDLHRSKKDRPDSWFSQQERLLAGMPTSAQQRGMLQHEELAQGNDTSRNPLMGQQVAHSATRDD